MRLGEIYKFVVKKGLEKDPRTKKELNEALKRVRKEYNKLKAPDKKYFDKEKLKHPFSDTRVLYGDSNTRVRTMMVGIDVDAGEILTAYLLNEKGAGVDLVMSHHPSGRALASLGDVMHVQTDLLKKLGVKDDAAKSMMAERIGQVKRGVSSRNHEKNVDLARILDVPFMCCHTPADNHVASFLQKLFDRKKPKKLNEVIRILKGIPEYQDGMSKNAGPVILSDKKDAKAGKIFVDMTGGTEGSKRVFSRLHQAGVNTIIGMHLSEEHLKAAKAEYMNVIIAGHIASDNLGLNLILDELSKKEDFRIIPCSGFKRIKR